MDVATNLTGANLNQTNLKGAKLNGANLLQVLGRGITGTPQSLPVGWILQGGYLFGPGTYLPKVELTGVNLAAANLASAFLEGANLTNAFLGGSDLTDANLTGVTWSDTTCPDGKITSEGC